MFPEAPDSEKRAWKSRWPEGTGAGMWDRPPRGKGLLGQRHSMGPRGEEGRSGLEETFAPWALPSGGLDWFFLNGGHDPSDPTGDMGP